MLNRTRHFLRLQTRLCNTRLQERGFHTMNIITNHVTNFDTIASDTAIVNTTNAVTTAITTHTTNTTDTTTNNITTTDAAANNNITQDTIKSSIPLFQWLREHNNSCYKYKELNSEFWQKISSPYYDYPKYMVLFNNHVVITLSLVEYTGQKETIAIWRIQKYKYNKKTHMLEPSIIGNGPDNTMEIFNVDTGIMEINIHEKLQALFDQVNKE
jgi:hypothetical protein